MNMRQSPKNMNKDIRKAFLIFSLIATVAGAAIAWFAVDDYFLRIANAALKEEIAQSSRTSLLAVKNLNLKNNALEKEISNLNVQIADLNNTIDLIETDLEMTAEERDDFEKKYRREKNRMDELDSQISEIQDTADTLQKLEETDDELLMKYSKVYFLNENYAPESLSTIDPKYTYNPNEAYLFYTNTLRFLKNMLKDAADDGINLKVVSAYRSFAEQSQLKSAYTMVYGTGANQFSADQGYSEHQLGTTVDLTTPEIGAGFVGFDQTEAYGWLAKNAYKYGFILSYPKNNSYYQYEPWHWRFVGRDLADYLHEENKNFYNMDQRDIDEYQISFFD